MGVPAFFRWLTKKYPSIVVDCIELQGKDFDGRDIHVDTSEPNPNGVEFDNLYLDMNGIIHPCTHPENKPPPKNEDEMMVAIFECIDRLFAIVRPRKLLYMAIDGVAPRAKMNQQRSRRFRASKESKEKSESIANILAEMKRKGYKVPQKDDKEVAFDSNCITPGTPFMSRLAVCLNYYIHDRLNTDPGWKGIKVILSDASVPGEGEHKIMDYIRKQRAKPGYDANTQHCLCGADADLIMLGLATHEPNFTIIREEFIYNQTKKCEICAQTGHEMKECKGLENVEKSDIIEQKHNFIFVRLCVLREYLALELNMPSLPFPYDFERALDDWVFMCFFVGNDFLPHLPSLEIREGAIDRLVGLYKKTVYTTGGFITNSGDVHLDRVQLIMNDLAEMEDEIFQRRRRGDLNFRQRNKERKAAENLMKYQQELRLTGIADNKLLEVEEEAEPLDDVMLWVPGYKERYYHLKFHIEARNKAERFKFAHYYVTGLCWVLKYYYQGVPSWNWFYPHHYAPFASDFVDIEECVSTFPKDSKPFSPLEQLMGVFPAASSAHVPAPWAKLMYESNSPIIDFYPTDFMVDLNGKKFAWQGVALLPFVDEVRLRSALKNVQNQLTDEEKARNVRGEDKLFIGKGSKCFTNASQLKSSNEVLEFNADGLFGTVFVVESQFFQGDYVGSPVKGLPPVVHNTILCLQYRDPSYPSSFKFPASKLKGAVDPPKVLKPQDHPKNTHYRPQIGMTRNNQYMNATDASRRMIRFNMRSDPPRVWTDQRHPNPNYYGNRMADRIGWQARPQAPQSFRGYDRNRQGPRHSQYQSRSGNPRYPGYY